MIVFEAYDADVHNKTRRTEKTACGRGEEQEKHYMGKRQGPHSCIATSPIKRAINKPMRPMAFVKRLGPETDLNKHPFLNQTNSNKIS